MNTPGPTTTNVADDSATVGVQVGVVHTINQIYHIRPEATPKEEYEVGVCYLDNGMPKRALELIDRAIARGHLNGEVRFHQLLALLSGRTIQMLSRRDFARLGTAREKPDIGTDDGWTDGIKMIERLLGNIAASDADHPIRFEEFDKIGEVQRRKIIRHLEMFLKGPIEDLVWRRAMREATEGQKASSRMSRTWKFFQPEPAAPRMHWPRPILITHGARIMVAAATAVFVAAAGYLGLLLIQRGQLPVIAAYLASAVGGYIWALNGMEWRFRNERLYQKNLEYCTIPRQRRSSPPGGFASQVDRLFRTYFRKYVPDGVDRATWLTETAALRRSIRDEIVNAYRDSPVEADSIAWLIRHRVGVVKQRWQQDTLCDYRQRYRTPLSTKLAVAFGASIVIVAGSWAAVGAVPVSPLPGSISVLMVAASGWIAAIGWLRIVVEHRRYADELAENEDVYVKSKAAHQRWLDKLADTPSDSEMAAWLECDRMMLMEEALRHYKLQPSNMIAHTFIEAPAPNSEHARVVNGPWRFSRYRLLVFLLTTDGVRQMAVELDFMNVSFENRQRTNYRFDAVASVRVTEGRNYERTFELALVSGYQFEIPVTGSGEEKLGIGEIPGTVADLTVDAAGLRNTLHILEGIAAEGKDWIAHEDQRSGERIRRLKSAVHGMTK
jgi:hypothetical protein